MYKWVSKILGIETVYQFKEVIPKTIIYSSVKELELFIPNLKTDKHFRSEHYVGDWSGAALYSSDGQWQTMRRSLDGNYTPTELLEKLPETKSLLNEFLQFGKLQRVRLLKTSPGTHVKYHIDLGETARSGVARLHIPIITDKDCKIVLNGTVNFWKPGELWYGDFSQPHELWNHSQIDRFHLVIDIMLNEHGNALFPKPFIKPGVHQKLGLMINQIVCVTKNSELKGYMINKIRGLT